MSDGWVRLVEDPNPWRAPRKPPSPVKTPRVVVRLYRKGDGPKLFEAVEADRLSLLPWMVWALTDHQDLTDSIHYVERCRRAAEKPDCTDFPMTILDEKEERILGGTGLHRIRPGSREAEIGYWIRGDSHGQGLCTEAIGALISQALAPSTSGGWGVRRILVYNDVENIGSRRVCEKLGLRLEMRLRKDRYLGSISEAESRGYGDTLGFAVLQDEWDFDRHRAKPGIGWGEDLTPG